MFSSARASLAARDSNRRALRRGLRVALVVPLTLALLDNVAWMSQGALFGVFSCLALLVFSDFGGDLNKRALPYLATTAAGVPLVLVGAYAGQALWSSVLMMAVVAMLVGMLGVLRGPVTSAQSVLLLGTVVALTSSSPSAAAADVAAWVAGGLIATASAVLLWPVRPSRPIRRHIADVLDAMAVAVTARWGPDPDAESLHQARARVTDTIGTLHTSYDGDLARPSGLTTSERALAELVDEVSRLRFMQKWEDLTTDKDPQWLRAAEQLSEGIVSSLHSCAARLRGDNDPISSEVLFESRQRNLTEITDWLDSDPDHESPSVKRRQIDDMFPLRITNLISARIADLTISLHPQPGDQQSRLDAAAGPVQSKPPNKRQRLRAHASWDSPWFRNALRSAVALSMSIAVAKSVNLEHPFWIVLGTLSALRFDALGTGRTARQALVGTAAGVVVGAALIMLFGPDPAVWWLLFPVTLFLAAYTPGTFSLAVGQAAFSLVVIVLFSIIDPARLDTATSRIIDVALGLGISLLVSLLMWPRGVVQTLNRRFTDAMAAACDFYVASVDWMVGGAIDDRLYAEFQARSYAALDRATEALDLSIAQRPPQAIVLSSWTAFSNTMAHVDFAARLTPTAVAVVRARGADEPVPDALVGPMLAGANDVRSHLLEVTGKWCDQQLYGAAHDDEARHDQEPDFTLSPAVINQRRAINAFLASPGQWHGSGGDPRPVIITWLTDWSAMLDRGAQVLARSAS